MKIATSLERETLEAQEMVHTYNYNVDQYDHDYNLHECAALIVVRVIRVLHGELELAM